MAYAWIKWINQPPIWQPKKKEMVGLCTQFISKVQSSERPASDEERVWRDRISWAEAKALTIQQNANDASAEHKHIFIAYQILGTLVGLMQYNDEATKGVVWNLAMLPGRENVGAHLLEYAVNLSEEAGHEGRVSFPAFHNNGWLYRQPWLDHLQSEDVVPSNGGWSKVAGKWRLTRWPNSRELNWCQVTIWSACFRQL